MNNVQKLIDELANRNLTIGSVESFTGGLFAKTFTDVSGASKVFKGSIVAYSPEVKVNVVGIPQEYIDKYGYSYSSSSNEIKIDDQEIEPNNYNMFDHYPRFRLCYFLQDK